MHKISVVMPIYNSEKYIKEAVDSVLNQTYKDFELLAIYDNGTNDNTPEILENYAKEDKRVKSINIREERGLVKALNYGMGIAQGEYIARMDADDICRPERFEEQIKYLNENRNIEILGTMVEVIGDMDENFKLNLEKNLNLEFSNVNAEECILNHWYCLAHPSVIFRKSTIQFLGGYSNHVAEDLDLWLRCLKNNNTVFKLNKKLISYRVHNEAKTQVVNKNYDGIRDAIELKINYVFDSRDIEKINCTIWGASNAGKLTLDSLKINFPEFNVVGFIDKFKTGEFEKIKIFNPDEISNIKFDYVFIATEPGKEEAINKLKSIGLKSIEDFLCTI